MLPLNLYFHALVLMFALSIAPLKAQEKVEKERKKQQETCEHLEKTLKMYHAALHQSQDGAERAAYTNLIHALSLAFQQDCPKKPAVTVPR